MQNFLENAGSIVALVLHINQAIAKDAQKNIVKAIVFPVIV